MCIFVFGFFFPEPVDGLTTERKRTGCKPIHPAKGCFQCTICKQTYNSQLLAQCHLTRVHLNAHRPYSCTICPLKFKEKCALNKHMARRHEVSNHSPW